MPRLPNLDDFIEVSQKAGEAILEVYKNTIEVTYKKDASPLTEADRRSHTILVDFFQKKFPQLPVLSEEGKTIPKTVRASWEWCLCVDPLDGTKEFVKKNGEFSINIALLYQGKSVVGSLYSPVMGKGWGAEKGKGAYIWQGGWKPLKAKPVLTFTVMASRSHRNKRLDAILQTLPPHQKYFQGSALKFAALAEGKAHLYIRLGPTMAWDTASGQLLVEEVGGAMLNFKGESFAYPLKELTNPPFLAYHPALKEIFPEFPRWLAKLTL